MKKTNFLLMLVMTSFLGFAQIAPTQYRGAFAPAPAAMWTDSWTNFDPQNTVYPTATVTVNSAITTSTTWTAGNTYLLSGQIYVKNNATLTIQPGVKVLGDLNGSALIITKGAKLNAIGTAANPIVFTSDRPVGQRTKGDWGGIILLGKGSFNINGGVNNIEGLAATADTQYGGGATPDDNDSSGTLKYVRIEFGGYVYAANSEINGLTMGAVGRGTVIDYVQVSHVNDDAFEWFGGSVDCKHLVSYKTLDDDFDTDNGYNGRVQFALAVRDPQVADAPAVSTSEGFESDNNPTGSTVTPTTSAIFSNITMVGPSYRLTLPNGGTLASGYKRVARIRRASQLKIYNSVFMDYQEGLHIDGVAAENNAVNGTLRFNNNILAGIVTTSKVLQVTSPGTITAGNNASFNMTDWYAANGNSTLATNAGLLTNPYNNSNALVYTGLDYRPATESPALTGASFTDTPFAGIIDVLAPAVVSPIYLCQYSAPTPLTATLSYATQLRWYTNPTGGSPLASAPSPSTSTINSKNYYVSQVNSNGIEGPRSVINVNVTAVPVAPVAITGTTTVCSYVGTTTPVTYSIAPVSGATTYQWTLPAGVNLVSTASDGLSIVVNFADVTTGSGTVGLISVKSVSSIGCTSAAKVLSLSKSLPISPGTITGVIAVGNFVGTQTPKTYSVVAVPSAVSYLWEVPAGVEIVSGQGTNSISVNFQNVASGAGAVGNISVKSVSGCGSSVVRTLALSKGLPAKPSVINTTQSNVCLVVGTSTNVTYSIPTIADVNTFQWTVPTGATIIGSTSGTSIVVNYSSEFTATGNISVRSVSGTGISNPRTLSVVRAIPTVPSTISGPIASICSNVVYNYSFAATASANSYSITAPTGAIITTTNFPTNGGNTITTNETSFSVVYPEGFVSGTIVLTSSNGCANSTTSRTITVNKATATPMPITGLTTINCATLGQQVTYSTSAVSLPTTYTWTVPTGTTIVSGQGTNTLVVTFSSAISTGAKIRLKASTECGGFSLDRVVTLTETTCLEGDSDEEIISEEAKTTVSVKSYPNPFTSTFKLDLVSVSKENVQVTVYDMSGNVVEKRTVTSSDINNVELGTKYRTGIYNVVLTQGAFTKTIRVAKN